MILEDYSSPKLQKMKFQQKSNDKGRSFFWYIWSEIMLTKQHNGIIIIIMAPMDT